jgi:tRNA pseudouridine38-40 synthase
MAETADHYLGRRDFGAFGSAPIEGGHTIREIYESAWESGEEAASFVIAGDAFLYRMVRRLVAAAIDVGLGRVEIDEVLACLSNPGQHWQASLAPSYGLCLEAVEFETD